MYKRFLQFALVAALVAPAITPLAAQAPTSRGLVSYMGAYNSAIIYTKGDVVVSGGASYISLIPHNGGNNPASTPADWAAFAVGTPGAAGAAGSAGAQGPAGPAGTAGAVGATGAQGPAGTAGTAGAAGAAGATGSAGQAGPAGPAGASVALQTNGTANGSQSILNLAAGTNVTLANSGGTVTINSSASGGTAGPQTIAYPTPTDVLTINDANCPVAGCTFSGYYWKSTVPGQNVIQILTSHPVTLSNDKIEGMGIPIYGNAQYNGGLHVIITNNEIIVVSPTDPTIDKSGGVYLQGVVSADVLHNTLHNVATGIVVAQSTSATHLVIDYNRGSNDDDRTGTVNNAYPYQLQRAGLGHFILMDVVSCPGCEIAWNQYIGLPNVSSTEDIVNLSSVAGTSASHFTVHDNYLQGAFTSLPVSGQVGYTYTGSGIITDFDGSNSNTIKTSFVDITNNQVVNVAEQGIDIASGHDNTVSSNRVISTGMTTTAVGGQFLTTGATGQAAYVLANFYNDSSFLNNTISNNFSQFVTPNTAQVGVRSETYAYAGLDPSDTITGNTTDTNPTNVAEVTTALETAEFATWQSKLATAGYTVGTDGTVPVSVNGQAQTYAQGVIGTVNGKGGSAVTLTCADIGCVSISQYTLPRIPGVLQISQLPTNIPAATNIAGVLPVVNGGTGTSVGPSATGAILTDDGSKKPIWQVMNGDCTINTVGLMTCRKTNAVSFATSATVDTTNASNITSGTLALARLQGHNGPTPTCTVGAAAGAGATCTVSGADAAHVITVATGTATTTSAVLVTITYGTAAGTAPIGCTITPRGVSSAAQVATLYATAPTTTSYTLSVAGSAIPASTTFVWYDTCQ